MRIVGGHGRQFPLSFRPSPLQWILKLEGTGRRSTFALLGPSGMPFDLRRRPLSSLFFLLSIVFARESVSIRGELSDAGLHLYSARSMNDPSSRTASRVSYLSPRQHVHRHIYFLSIVHLAKGAAAPHLRSSSEIRGTGYSSTLSAMTLRRQASVRFGHHRPANHDEYLRETWRSDGHSYRRRTTDGVCCM
ncbi:hypothetical protein BKA93DRAFT_106720 [Sparassis latifolia]